MKERSLSLVVLPGSYAVCRLRPGEPLPDTALHGDFVSVTRTRDEVSVVCSEGQVPAGAKVEVGWRCLKAEGQLDFALTGVLAALAVPLAEAGVSIFAVSTYDTDYVLAKAEVLERAVAALEAAGHRVHQDTEKAEPQPEEPKHTEPGITPEAVERMLRTSREIMRGRYVTDDSTDLLREARDERTEEL